MKIKKVYTMRINEAMLTFMLGKTPVKASFLNGNINATPVVPARCITDNPIAQHAIESDNRFGSVIKLESAYDENGKPLKVVKNMFVDLPEVKQPKAKSAEVTGDRTNPVVENTGENTTSARGAENASGITGAIADSEHAGGGDVGSDGRIVLEDVVDINGVVEYLKTQGSKGNQLLSTKSILAQCERFNVSFPNVEQLKIQE